MADFSFFFVCVYFTIRLLFFKRKYSQCLIYSFQGNNKIDSLKLQVGEAARGGDYSSTYYRS